MNIKITENTKKRQLLIYSGVFLALTIILGNLFFYSGFLKNSDDPNYSKAQEEMALDQRYDGVSGLAEIMGPEGEQEPVIGQVYTIKVENIADRTGELLNSEMATCTLEVDNEVFTTSSITEGECLIPVKQADTTIPGGEVKINDQYPDNPTENALEFTGKIPLNEDPNPIEPQEPSEPQEPVEIVENPDEVEVDCIDGLVGAPTKCYLNPPENKAVPQNTTKLAVGSNSQNFGGFCEDYPKEDDPNVVVCKDVPTPESPEDGKVFLKLADDKEPAETPETVVLTNEIVEFNQAETLEMRTPTSLICRPNPVEINNSLNCGGDLPSNITPPSQDLFLSLEGVEGSRSRCNFDSNDAGASFECIGLTSGPESAERKVLGTVNDNEAEFTGVIITVEESTPEPTPQKNQDQTPESTSSTKNTPSDTTQKPQSTADSGGIATYGVIGLFVIALAGLIYLKVKKPAPESDFKKI
jgi:hypothetical protein